MDKVDLRQATTMDVHITFEVPREATLETLCYCEILTRAIPPHDRIYDSGFQRVYT